MTWLPAWRGRAAAIWPPDDELDENRFEQENRVFFERVHQQFLAIAHREPERVVLIDARRRVEEVHNDVVAAVRERLLARQG